MNAADFRKGAESAIGKLKDELIYRTGNKITIDTEIREGTFFHELDLLCEKINPYTVIMGSQGTTATERLVFGGHTVHAARYLKWPLITVPVDAVFSNIKKIGLACDFVKVTDSTPIQEIKNLVTDFKAELHVLNTGKKEAFDPAIVFESGMLQEMILDLNPRYHFITDENTDEGIMEFTEKNKIDLLIVLPRRHSIFEKLMNKSHTRQLVLHCPVPVMAMHQPLENG
jgi:nucleotide-binding universal stress UspA family protein